MLGLRKMCCLPTEAAALNHQSTCGYVLRSERILTFVLLLSCHFYLSCNMKKQTNNKHKEGQRVSPPLLLPDPLEREQSLFFSPVAGSADSLSHILTRRQKLRLQLLGLTVAQMIPLIAHSVARWEKITSTLFHSPARSPPQDSRK